MIVCGHATAYGEQQPGSEAGWSSGGVGFWPQESKRFSGAEKSNSQRSSKCAQGVSKCECYINPRICKDLFSTFEFHFDLSF